MDDLLNGLTEPQREAVNHIDGPLLMLAGPGSGKTRVVTHRIANLLRQGVPAWQIVALTFTNKAAGEMRTRVESLAPGQPVWMGTFHRFCARLLRRYASMVGLSENYSIYDAADSRQAIKRACEVAEVTLSHTSPDAVASVISRAKNRLVTAEMMATMQLKHNEQVAAQVYPVYQRLMMTANAVDFDDLLLHVAVMLRDNAELRSELDARYRYILVDEYQDTNLAQYAIVRALSIDYPNLSVTGDPDQSIYGWRGADLNNILDFENDYPNVKTVRLEQNYRSTPNILRVADELIRHNRRRKHKQLFTSNPEGEPVVLKAYRDGKAEGDDIAERIAHAILEENCRPRDFAIFFRMNSLTRTLEHALRRCSLPYQIVNGVEFYQRKEIKDLLAYLHLINNPSHDVALERIINVPTRGIGATTIRRLRQVADRENITMLDACRKAGLIESIPKRSATKVAAFVALYDSLCVKATATVEDLLEYLLEETEYREYLERAGEDDEDNDRLANVDELVTAAVEYDRQHPEDGSLEEFLEQIALVSSTDDWEDNDDRVTLMTLHASKGLEFPRVFVIGVEDDLLPHARSKESDDQIEEERRLLFVGITRARERLQLSYCNCRSVHGDYRPVVPSPFLMELPRGEMRQVENETDPDFFDADPYPDSWDIPDEDGPDEYSQLTEDDPDDFVEEARPSFKPAKVRPPVAIPQLKTAAQMAGGATSLAASLKAGMSVMHPKHGEGTVVSMTGRGPKCTATIRFDDGETKSFRVAFADLRPIV
jgi:DNA helicase-2/ATP-dependent DNA helicase PcrA